MRKTAVLPIVPFLAVLTRTAFCVPAESSVPVSAETPVPAFSRVPADEAVDCISPEQRARMDANIQAYYAAHGGDLSLKADRARRSKSPRLYTFYPMAGTWDRDLLCNNFVDLDPTAGILTWECGARSYNGHKGHDVGPFLREWEKMDIGLPEFAALDGTVVDAHDGEYDRNTSCTGNPNYVAIDHGNGQRTIYYHMKKGSVAVSVGQFVKAGTQIGLMGSSGCSTDPHLHFESQMDGGPYEPFAGACRPGPSNWAAQPSYRTDTYVYEVYVTNNDVPDGMMVEGQHLVGLNYAVKNMPANSTLRFRFVRPDGSILHDSGTFGAGNTGFYNLSTWLYHWTLNLDAAGTWHILLDINGVTEVSAPFTVVATAAEAVNRPPEAATLSFDPARPGTDDVIFCRITSPWLYKDPDYDLVRYHYVWKVNGNVVRNVTHTGLADCIPHDEGKVGDTIQCSVTPYDGHEFGSTTTISVDLGYPWGDVNGNGVLNTFDPELALWVGGGILNATQGWVDRGDVNNNGRLDMHDATRILRHLEGL